MRKKGILNRLIAMTMMLILFFSTCGAHMQKVFANENEEHVEIQISTKTLERYYDNLENMTDEEFYEIFGSEEYERDFYYTYECVKRGDSKLKKFREVVAKLRNEDIERLVDEVYQKVPEIIKQNVNESVLRTGIKTLLKKLNVQNATSTVIAATIKCFTGMPTIITKPLIDIIINVSCKVIDKIIENRESNEDDDTNIVDDQTQEVTLEPMDGENNDGLLNYPPEVDENEGPIETPIETGIPEAA